MFHTVLTTYVRAWNVKREKAEALLKWRQNGENRKISGNSGKFVGKISTRKFHCLEHLVLMIGGSALHTSAAYSIIIIIIIIRI